MKINGGMGKINFIVPGKPFGKQRKVTNRSGITYMPKETLMYENHVRACFMTACKGHLNPSADPLHAEIKAFFQIPDSWPKKRKKVAETEDMPCLLRPDIDNIEKIVFDALNGLAYNDDKQIYSVICSKYYSARPRVEITLSNQQVKTALVSPSEKALSSLKTDQQTFQNSLFQHLS